MTRYLSLESPKKALSGIVTSSLPSTILLHLVGERERRKERERERKREKKDIGYQ